MDSKLSASSNETDVAAVAGEETSAEPEASSDHETPKELDAPSSLVTNPEGVPVSVRSSSDWEVVTTPDATFLGVALVARAAPDGVEVSGGTYSDLLYWSLFGGGSTPINWIGELLRRMNRTLGPTLHYNVPTKALSTPVNVW